MEQCRNPLQCLLCLQAAWRNVSVGGNAWSSGTSAGVQPSWAMAPSMKLVALLVAKREKLGMILDLGMVLINLLMIVSRAAPQWSCVHAHGSAVKCHY